MRHLARIFLVAAVVLMALTAIKSATAGGQLTRCSSCATCENTRCRSYVGRYEGAYGLDYTQRAKGYSRVYSPNRSR